MRTLVLMAAAVVSVSVAVSLTPQHMIAAIGETRPAQASTQGPARVAHILFAGDMQFDRHIRDVIDAKGDDAVFGCMAETLGSFDTVVANLEGPITENESRSRGSKVGSPENFSFTFPSRTAETLKAHNIGIVNIGNNHITNFGLEGFATTQGFLMHADVGYFGGIKTDDAVYRTEIEGNIISFVSYNQFGGDSAEATADKIRREKTAGRTVIVYTHWGEEYRPATLNEKSLALIFVTAGADAILGSHPHVVQEDAIVAGVPVFYSLGNFIFDQYWNESVSRGLAVELIVGQDGITVGKRYVTASTFAGSTCLIED